MRAVVCRTFAPIDQLVIEERPSPEMFPSCVRIAVNACGVNFVDGLFVQGKYQIKPPTPFVPGMEVVGRVTEVGPRVDGVPRVVEAEPAADLTSRYVRVVLKDPPR